MKHKKEIIKAAKDFLKALNKLRCPHDVPMDGDVRQHIQYFIREVKKAQED